MGIIEQIKSRKETSNEKDPKVPLFAADGVAGGCRFCRLHKEPAPGRGDEPSADETKAPEATATEEPKPQETNIQDADADSYLNVLLKSEPSSLDVAKFLDTYSRSVMYNILEPLTRVQNGVVTGAGAESWEISEDGLTYTFHLRDNRWSDGQAVVAGDYLYALQRQADPTNAWPLASDMYSIAGFEDVFSGAAAADALGVTAPDDKTLVITLGNADAGFLTNTDIFPCRQDYAEKYGDQYGADADKIIGCGPFVLKEWNHSSSLVFEKNDQYWEADAVKLTKYTSHIMEDVNAMMSSFENGSLDYVSVSNIDYIHKFSADSNLTSKKMSAARTFMIVFNCEDPVFSNQKIRLAFSLALDRETMAEIITGGTGTVATGLIPNECNVGSLNFREAAGDVIGKLQNENPDPKALLIAGMEEAGLGSDPSALTVKFAWGATTADARTYSELIQQMWQETLGVKVELEFNDSSTHMSNVNTGNYQMASTSWGANPEPWFQLSRWANKKGGQSRWANSEYMQLVKQGVSTQDEAQRLELYRQAEEMLLSEAAIAPCYWTGSIRFSYGYVKNFSDNVFDTTGMKYLYTQGR